MAEYRTIKIRIWQDNWFLSLSPEEKLLWLFLLTNQNFHISGLYELPKPLISPFTGVQNWEEILAKFSKQKKIFYNGGDWIYIPNCQKHQPISGSSKDNINKAIKKYLKEHSEILANLTKEHKPLQSPSQAPSKGLGSPSSKYKNKNKKLKLNNITPSKIMNKFIKEEEFREEIINNIYNKYNIPIEIVRKEVNSFLSYWTEPTKSGRQQRWETEKTFELTRRLATWFRNWQKFNKSNQPQIYDLRNL